MRWPAWGSATGRPARRSSGRTGLWTDEDGAWVTPRFSGRQGLWGGPPVRDPRSRGSGRSGTGWWSWGSDSICDSAAWDRPHWELAPFGSVAVHDGALEGSPPIARESGRPDQSHPLKRVRPINTVHETKNRDSFQSINKMQGTAEKTPLDLKHPMPLIPTASTTNEGRSSAPGSAGGRIGRSRIPSPARRQTAFNVRPTLGRWSVQRTWIEPRWAAVPVVSGGCPKPSPGHR